MMEYFMPSISNFYGITIKMFFGDHNPAHFHAVYGEFNGVFDLDSLEMTEGDLPKRAINLIKEWATIHKNELIYIWENNDYIKIPGLK